MANRHEIDMLLLAGAYAVATLLLLATAAHASPACAAAPFAEPHIDDSFEVCHKGYESLQDPHLKQTRLVMYHLKSSMLFGDQSRADMRFTVDDLAPAEDQAGASDYAHSGYDLGHMAPAEDFAKDEDLERDTFKMTNVSPQLPGLNRQGWERIEDWARAEACVYGDVDIVTGPIFRAHPAITFGRDHVAVPEAFFKIIVPKGGDPIAFLAPNQPISKEDALTTLTSVSAIEKAIGFDIPGLDASTQVFTPNPQNLEDFRKHDCK